MTKQTTIVVIGALRIKLFMYAIKALFLHFALYVFKTAYIGPNKKFYFIVSGEISVYLMKIKVVSITSE